MGTKVILNILLMMNCLFLLKSHAKGIPVQTNVDEYYFGDKTKMTWLKAKEFCEGLGMGLLTPDTQEKNDRIIEEIKKKGFKEDFWTSGNDIEMEGKYVWNLTGRLLGYTKWAHPQPDNYPSNIKGEDCIQLRYLEHKYEWNDLSCYNENYFICEKMQKTSEVLPTTTESNPNLSISSSSEKLPEPAAIKAANIPVQTIVDEYYFGDKTKMTWLKAKDSCESLEMGLLTPDTKEENDKIFEELKKKGSNEYFWTSGNDIEFEGKYVWNLTGRPFSFTQWDAGEPNSWGGIKNPENCIHLRHLNNEKDARWNDVSCDNKYYFICQKVNKASGILPTTTESNPKLSISTSSEKSPEPAASKAANIPVQTIVDEYYFGDKTKMTWLKAKDSCESLGMGLLTPDTKEENGKIIEELKKKGTKEDFWTSGNDKELEGKYVWDLTGRPFSFTHWAAGEPNNKSPNVAGEDCITVGRYTEQIGARWNDVSCDALFYFICQKVNKASEVLPTTEEMNPNLSISTSSEKSPEPAARKAANIPVQNIVDEYYFEDKTKMTWSKAKDLCESLGMGLLTPDTKEKNDRIFEEIKIKGTKEDFWTSGNDLEIEGNYVWDLTGRAFCFTDWAAGEPNNLKNPNAAGENCIHLRHSEKQIGARWSDVSCDQKNYFICEKVNKASEVLPSTTESYPSISSTTHTEKSLETTASKAADIPVQTIVDEYYFGDKTKMAWLKARKHIIQITYSRVSFLTYIAE